MFIRFFIFYILSILSVNAEESDISNFFHAQKQNYHPVYGNLSVVLLMRSFNGHRHKFHSMLGPSLARFVDLVRYPLIAVLDDHSPADHTWFGKELEDRGFTVYYEPLPAAEILNRRPFGVKGAYGTDGYVQQLYSTFFFDNYTDADIIGIVDADVIFNTFLTIQSIIDTQGRLFKAALHGNHFKADAICLKEDVNINFMSTEVMPQFFFRDTFAKLREHIMQLFNVSTFDDAWKQFAVAEFSPANLLSFYGVTREVDKYHIILPEDIEGMITVGNNRPGSDPVWKVACCRMYGSENRDCPTNWVQDTTHATTPEGVGWYKYLNIEANTKQAWAYNATLVDAHYRNVAAALEGIDPDRRERMKNACG